MKINEPITNNELKMLDGQILVSRTNLKGIITYCNEEFIEMSGFNRDELIGKNHNLVRHPDMPQEAFQWLWQDVKDGKPWCAMVKNRRKNGDFYWVEANVTPVYENGEIIEYLSVRQKPTEAQISEADALYKKINAKEASLFTQTFFQKINIFSNLGLAGKIGLPIASLTLTVIILLYLQFNEIMLDVSIEILIGAISALLAFLSFTSVKSVIDSLDTANRIFAQIGEGNFKNTINLTKSDESGLVLRELFKVQTKLNSDMDREKEMSAINMRIKIALDNVSSNVMVADNNRNIIYMNKSASVMFKLAEAGIKKELPNFDADNLINTNIDGFHKNPAHQSKLLATFTSTFETEMVVGGHTMSIVANPVINDNGDRLGSVVEWGDRTLEVAIENEIGDLVSATQAGDLSKRLSEDGKSGFTLTLIQNLNAMLEVLNNAFNDVNSVMSSLSNGELNQKITSEYDGVYNEVKFNVNNTIEQVSEIMGELRQSTNDITSNSKELASGNANLSSRTEQQAAALEETASNMEELTSTVQQNAKNAQQADQLASSARSEAMKGGEVVSNAIEAMNAISQSSNKIADIIGVIDEIAFQTNLLALNASVEAARAGDQGRGFAVVATEVRNLAQRSATAAKEIKDLIQDSVAKVDSGSSLVNESGETLEKIVEGIQKVGDIVAEISSASREQTDGIVQINQTVSSMDDLTQQNAALAEQASASSVSMSERANKMSQTMGFFKL